MEAALLALEALLGAGATDDRLGGAEPLARAGAAGLGPELVDAVGEARRLGGLPGVVLLAQLLPEPGPPRDGLLELSTDLGKCSHTRTNVPPASVIPRQDGGTMNALPV